MDNDEGCDTVNYKESLKYLNACKLAQYVIPVNVKININTAFNYKLSSVEIKYEQFSKKYKKIIDDLDSYYMQYNKSATSANRSIHIANISYKKQQVTRVNDYERTYHNRTNITSYHAEYSAICSYCKINKRGSTSNKNCTLCVVRYNKQGIRCNSKPCSFCMYTIVNHSIKTIIYSSKDNIFQICKIATF